MLPCKLTSGNATATVASSLRLTLTRLTLRPLWSLRVTQTVNRGRGRGSAGSEVATLAVAPLWGITVLDEIAVCFGRG